MSNIAGCLAHTLAHFFDLFLLPLVILLPRCPFSSFRKHICIVVSIVFFQVMSMFIDFENLVDGSIEELSIVRYQQNSTSIVGEIKLKSFQAYNVDRNRRSFQKRRIRETKTQWSQANP